MRIENILRTKGADVATIEPTATVAQAAQRLSEVGVGALVVSADRRHILGILSERDIARGLAIHGPGVGDLHVEQLMTREVATCCKTDTVDELMAVMTERRVRHLPVTENGVLAGIVSIGDVVKRRLGELEQENHTLHDYLEIGR